MSFRDLDLLIDGEPRRVSAELAAGTLVLREGDHVLEAAVRRISASELLFRIGGRMVRVHLVRDGGRTLVAIEGRDFTVTAGRPGTGRPGESDEPGAEAVVRVKAPMPGKVTKIAVAEGDDVRKNQTLVIVEAMKMENEIKAACDGTVTKIHVTVGETVDAERPLVEVEKRPAASS
jgi:acetyl/propionyl-CoA carboxylase alpha subunit